MRTLYALLALGTLAVFAPAAEDPKKVEEGKPAPEITLPAANIATAFPDLKDKKSLSIPKDAKGKNVVLFFYPKALTPGCTVESCGFRDKIKDFEKLDTVVIGISTDTVAKQAEFTEKEKLNFPLFADADKSAAKAYGVLSERAGVAMRWTFVIDKKGNVAKIYNKVDTKTHPQEVLDYVKDNLK